MRIELEHLDDGPAAWFATVWFGTDLAHVTAASSTSLDAISAARDWVGLNLARLAA